ncbi:response regulator [Allorhodopirellula solitaria]|uniref:Transcriptional regulatory protein TcrA n=1 Tax=Allorhodopirellula solitaria TaxID=2527987 RepID=A0A5C5XT49_9BACT|nr:response regulator [Allorhodopirellula solitaria]TWT66044.1 Transcriptional regulatory protein TcrA [Allorhodopirellula solitaria]
MEESLSFKILIVEDQRALRMVMSRLLTKLGHQVEAVESGPAAIAALDQFCPEVIFSDISMPEMNGYELVRLLRQREELTGTYFVAMTGMGKQSDDDSVRDSRFDEHLVKPVDVERLQQLFEQLSRR